MFDRPQQPSVWQGLQDSVDRSTGRIVDEPTFQLDRIERRRAEDYGRIPEQTEFQRFQEERERNLRIEQQQRALQIENERQRRDELDRREYELMLRAGLSTTSAQAAADEQALRQAKGRRDQQIFAADNARFEALRAQGANRTQIDSTYQQTIRDIRQQYEGERSRILGLPPATQPSN